MISLRQRFEKKYIPEPMSGCWLWEASLNGTKGYYGQIRTGNTMSLAHRVSYELHKGKIPKGKFVLHTCDVPSCVNPDHLFLGTQLDNMLDKKIKNRCHSNKGSENGRSKLTEKEVTEIKLLLNSNLFLQKEIAEMFNVAQNTVSSISTGYTWKHMKEKDN